MPPLPCHCRIRLAERVGFEPTVPCGTPVFKTGAIDHSATSPIQLCPSGNGHRERNVATSLQKLNLDAANFSRGRIRSAALPVLQRGVGESAFFVARFVVAPVVNLQALLQSQLAAIRHLPLAQKIGKLRREGEAIRPA